MTARNAPSLIATGTKREQRVRGRAARSALIALIAVLALPAAAQAASVRIDGDTLVYQSAPGEKDVIGADDFETKAWSIRGSFVQAGPGCQQAPPASYVPQITCPLTAKATIDLGDQDDTVGVFVQGLTVTISAGTGDDIINDREFHGTIDGGPGRDRLRGDGPGTLTGGSGNDTIRAAAGAVIDAGAGNDRVITRSAGNTRLGPGSDSWRGNNGGPVVRIDGGPGDDSFIGEYGCQCAFFAGAGNDTFDLVSRLTLPAKYRGQLVDGGPGTDGGFVDGYDCTRSLEHATVTKRTNSDRRFRCHTPAAKVR